MFWFFDRKAFGIWNPQPGIEPPPLCTGRWSLNNWTARAVPSGLLCDWRVSLPTSPVAEVPVSFLMVAIPQLGAQLCLFLSFLDTASDPGLVNSLLVVLESGPRCACFWKPWSFLRIMLLFKKMSGRKEWSTKTCSRDELPKEYVKWKKTVRK